MDPLYNTFQEFYILDISVEARHQLTDAIYNELVMSVLTILDKLDLRCYSGQSAMVCTQSPNILTTFLVYLFFSL